MINEIDWHKSASSKQDAFDKATMGILFVGGCADGKTYPMKSTHVEVGCDVDGIEHTLRYRYEPVRIERMNGDFGFICIPACDQVEFHSLPVN